LNDKEQGLNYLKKGLELNPNYLEEHPDALAGLPMRGSALTDLYFNFARVFASRGEVEKAVQISKKSPGEWLQKLEIDRRRAGIRRYS